MEARLLERDQFREGVFARDNHKCVVCEEKAVDAHHVLERRLWGNGGYFLDNGVSVCEEHHIKAEQTVLSCEELREKAGIEKVLLPEHLYRDQQYDKWGNPILPNGTRLRGDLFWDESVQKILKEGGMLSVFTNRVKYPRTFHLPWSPGLTKDDRQMQSMTGFENQEIVVTLKMDGENTTMYSDFMHARSLTSESHPSRNRVRALHGEIAHNIPQDWRICGENLYAKHSIKYTSLPGYFMLFSIWDEKNNCLSWDETKTWAELLELPIVQELYRGTYNQKAIEEVFKPFKASHEGYVVRLTSPFPYSAFRHSVGKYVRKEHVHTHGHWMRQIVEPNELENS